MNYCRRFAIGLIALGLVSFAQTQASAQFGRGFGGGFGGGMNVPGLDRMGLLGIEEVQAELKMSDEQKESVKKMSEDMQAEGRKAFEGFDFMNATQEEREKKMADMAAKMAERGKTVREELDKLLDEKQNGRLKELLLQRFGYALLSQEDIAKEVGITDEQQAKLKEIDEDNSKKMGELFRGGFGGDREAMQKKMADQRKAYGEAITAALTQEQIDKFEDMKGDAFDFPAPRRRGPGGPGGPGGRPERRPEGQN